METNNITRVIIIAGGDAVRWDNYLGVQKHFIEIEGEKLIHRTIRLVKYFSPDAEIFVVRKNKKDKFDNAEVFVPTFHPEYYGIDKFLNSEELWNKKGRTVVLYGDVWFSDEALHSIMNYKGEAWIIFGRFGSSRWTHHPWGELFAQSFYPQDHEWHKSVLLYAVDLVDRGVLNDVGGWEHYCLMQGCEILNRQKGDRFFEIDDFTEYFDFPYDYDLWIGSRNRWRLGKTP